MWTSVPQMDVFLIRIRTSLIPGWGTGASMSWSPTPGLTLAMARMVFWDMAMGLLPGKLCRVVGETTPEAAYDSNGRIFFDHGFHGWARITHVAIRAVKSVVKPSEARCLLRQQLRALERQQAGLGLDATGRGKTGHLAARADEAV